jgi:hypothetical protein
VQVSFNINMQKKSPVSGGWLSRQSRHKQLIVLCLLNLVVWSVGTGLFASYFDDEKHSFGYYAVEVLVMTTLNTLLFGWHLIWPQKR